MTYLLGVDGGGSKTAFALANERGRVLAHCEGPSSYYFARDISVVSTVLADGVRRVCDLADVRPDDIDSAFFGLPGYGESSKDLEVLERIPATILGTARYSCDNDMVCSWAGSLGGQDGVSVISGTGSMAYGQRADRRCRVGGWGELFGDEGSAYWLAIKALNAFTRMSDGRLPRGPLYDVLSRRLNLAVDQDLVHLVINEWGSARQDIAALSREVGQSAARGDDVAVALLKRAGEELAVLASTTADGLGYAPTERVPVSYSGGVFANTFVREAFAGALAAGDRRVDLVVPMLSPVLGAVILAASRHGSALDASAISQLRSGAVQ